MSRIDSSRLIQCSTDNQLTPSEGPKAIAILLDFATLIAAGENPVLELDYSNQQVQGRFSLMQSLYADNGDNGSPLVITFESTQQRLIVPANSQAYLAVLSQNPLKIRFESAGNYVVPVHLLNFPVAPCVWSV